MPQDDLKRSVAEAAFELIAPDLLSNSIIGVGTGTTTNFFIDCLARNVGKFGSTVSSSEASTRLLRESGVSVEPLHNVPRVDFYVDGADEVDPTNNLIKGGGGALTREKIVAGCSDRFVCIVDESKVVDRLGTFPVPIELISSAQKLVSKRIFAMGGMPRVRDYITELGNIIIDVGGFSIDDPRTLESEINDIPGVVTVGIFAIHRPNQVLVGSKDGVTTKVALDTEV